MSARACFRRRCGRLPRQEGAYQKMTTRSGWLSRTVLAVTSLGMAGSVVAMAISYVRG